MSDIEIKGLAKLRLKLAFMKDPQGVRAGVKAAAAHVKGVAQIYPSRPSHSTYDRTSRLRS